MGSCGMLDFALCLESFEVPCGRDRIALFLECRDVVYLDHNEDIFVAQEEMYSRDWRCRYCAIVGGYWFAVFPSIPEGAGRVACQNERYRWSEPEDASALCFSYAVCRLSIWSCRGHGRTGESGPNSVSSFF